MNNSILEELRKAARKGLITKHQLKTLRGQVLSGNAQAAKKGLDKIVSRNLLIRKYRRKRHTIGQLYIDGQKLMDVYGFAMNANR